MVESWCSPWLFFRSIEESVVGLVDDCFVVVRCCMCFWSRRPSWGRVCPQGSLLAVCRRFSAGLFQVVS